MKHFLFLLIFLNSLSAIQYENNIPLFIQKNCSSLEKILENSRIKYQFMKSDYNDNSLYIITNVLEITKLPKNYIIFNNKKLNQNLFENHFEKFKNAKAIWDNDWNNIEIYRNKIFHYLYLSEGYEFVDVVILPLFIPVDFLSQYKELLEESNKSNNDFSSHLPIIFCHTVLKKPKMILEAGVASGQSTIAFHSASKIYKSKLIGIDIMDQWKSTYNDLENSKFICMNDLNFLKHYKNDPEIQNKKFEIIFIDTSHEYEHTLREIFLFLPLLQEDGIMIFHDSNVTPLNNNTGYYRLNNTYGTAYGNTRGVTKAIKKFFNKDFNEYKYQNFLFVKKNQQFHLIHYPFCNGLTIIKKIFNTSQPVS